MPRVRLSAAAVMAITIPAIGVFTVPVSGGGLPGLTVHAESKPKDTQAKVHALIDRLRQGEIPAAIAKSNGRIEATQIDVGAKYPGRLERVTVQEGDEVTVGQMIVRISSPEYEAELRGAPAQVLKAEQALAEAEALISQRKSDRVFTQSDLERGRQLVDKGYLTRQVFDQRAARAEAAEAGLHAAEAQRDAPQFPIKAAESEVEGINAILADLKLVSPRTGRVQYLIHRAGEVINAGARVVTILDLSDVYMTIYLSAAPAGSLALGDEARMTLDPFPPFVVPATVSFVAADAQFTPRSVETTDERAKLMFRIKLQIDPKVLGEYHKQVKTGVRGMGFVRTSSAISWPNDLTVKLPHDR